MQTSATREESKWLTTSSNHRKKGWVGEGCSCFLSKRVLLTLRLTCLSACFARARAVVASPPPPPPPSFRTPHPIHKSALSVGPIFVLVTSYLFRPVTCGAAGQCRAVSAWRELLSPQYWPPRESAFSSLTAYTFTTEDSQGKGRKASPLRAAALQ